MAEIDDLVTRRARAMLSKPNEPPEDDDDFGLFYPLWYAYDTWVEHEDHGLYPRDGGYDDQDWQLMQDWKTLDQRFGKAMREQDGSGGDGSGNGDDMMETLHQYSRGRQETNLRRMIE